MDEIQETISEIRRLTEKLTALNGNQTPDTKEPLLFGNGGFDVRIVNGNIRVGLRTEFGWVMTDFDPAGACSLSAQVTSLTSQILRVTQAQAEIATGINSVVH